MCDRNPNLSPQIAPTSQTEFCPGSYSPSDPGRGAPSEQQPGLSLFLSLSLSLFSLSFLSLSLSLSFSLSLSLSPSLSRSLCLCLCLSPSLSRSPCSRPQHLQPRASLGPSRCRHTPFWTVWLSSPRFYFKLYINPIYIYISYLHIIYIYRPRIYKLFQTLRSYPRRLLLIRHPSPDDS